MAWIYLVASEDSQSLYPSGCDPSHIAKSTPIVKECSCPECRLVNSRIAPYGMILKHSKGLDSYGDMSISYLEASRVRILASFFMRSSDCVAKLSLDLSFWKTYRPLLQEGDAKWLGPLPRWGMTVDGVLYQQRALERPIKERDGLFWPTPKASDSKRGDCPCERKRHTPSLRTALNVFHGTKSLKIDLNWLEWMMGYPSMWTELKPWATQWCLLKQKRRLKH